MSPFTHLFGRLVELLGAQSAAQLVREFNGQTIQFPITDYYDYKPRLHSPLAETEAKALTDKLVKESARTNGKKPLTHVQAARLLRERLQYPAYLQDALQKFQQETLANHCPEFLAQGCDCLRSAHSPLPEHPASLGDEGDK